MINSDDPVYPHPAFKDSYGITVRAEFAAGAMKAMLSNPIYHSHTSDQIAAKAVKYADALIIELNKDTSKS